MKTFKEIWEDSMEELYYNDEKEITDLLMFRKIVEVKNGDTLILDNGLELEVVPNDGCGRCASGGYEISELNVCDNAITNVEFQEVEYESRDSWQDYSYRIFVIAENKRIKILQVDGTDGNGYYGTGYSINVKIKK